MKIVDFGTAVTIEKRKKLKLATGTRFYMAPEVFEGNYSEKCDIWSIGVICYMLLCGKNPFVGRNHGEIYHDIKEGVKFDEGDWNGISDDAKTFVEYLLTMD